LIRNKRPWKSGPVEALPVSGMKLYPGDSVYWDFADRTYLVYAEGGIRRNRKGVPQEVWNYKLWVTSTVSGVARKSLLVATPRVQDGLPVFRFAGDVDNDGLLDWILTTSESTFPTTWVWYLSKEATGRELVVPAAQYRAVGCCGRPNEVFFSVFLRIWADFCPINQPMCCFSQPFGLLNPSGWTTFPLLCSLCCLLCRPFWMLNLENRGNYGPRTPQNKFSATAEN
jgi:hypothetical protein